MGTILAFGFNYPPMECATCDGTLLNITQNSALFSLLGTNFGGNGVQNFALPDLRGRAIIGQGFGSNLTNRLLGQMGGYEKVTLNSNQMPTHTHTATFTGTSVTIKASGTNGSAAIASSRASTIGGATAGNLYNNDTAPAIALNVGGGSVAGTVAVAPTGSNTPVDNMQPYTVLNFCIVTQGLYPSRQ